MLPVNRAQHDFSRNWMPMGSNTNDSEISLNFKRKSVLPG